jgi:hypothetical protein
MLARSCLRSTRAVGAVRNGAVNTTKVRQQTILESDNEDTIHCQMCWKGSIELDFELTVDIVACRIFLELFNRGFNPLPIERSWISCYCCGYWIAGLVLSSLWRSSTGHDTNRRRVSFNGLLIASRTYTGSEGTGNTNEHRRSQVCITYNNITDILIASMQQSTPGFIKGGQRHMTTKRKGPLSHCQAPINISTVSAEGSKSTAKCAPPATLSAESPTGHWLVLPTQSTKQKQWQRRMNTTPNLTMKVKLKSDRESFPIIFPVLTRMMKLLVLQTMELCPRI